jgi:tetratricopeptide (TPR) repeat protein
MPTGSKFSGTAVFLTVILTTSLAHAQHSALDAYGTNAPSSQAPAPSPAALPPPSPVAVPDPPGTAEVRASFDLLSKGKVDDALAQVNAAIQLAPQNSDAYGMRGSIYTEKKQWDLAQQDFQKVLELRPNDVSARFNLSEVKFRQKQYDDARVGFAALAKDVQLGDLAAYKMFLCDLYGGHADAADKELAVFNQAGGNPSYYFGNAAYSLYHKNTEDGRGWLISAVQIYSQNKVNLYAASLKDLGYLPLPPPPPKD